MNPMCSAKLFIQARSFHEGAHMAKIARAKNVSSLQHLWDISKLSKSKNLWGSFRHFGTVQKIGNSKQKSQGKIDRSANIVEAIQKISKTFQDNNIDAVIGGSLAAMVNIPPRMTKDIDLNIRDRNKPDSPISEKELKKVLSQCKRFDMNTFKYTKTHVPKKYSPLKPQIVMANGLWHGWPVDMYIYTEGDVRKRLFSNPVELKKIQFAPPECICFWKMMSFKDDTRYHKDRQDVVDMLLSCKSLDCQWVTQQIEKHDGTEGPRVKEWVHLVKTHRSLAR